MRAVHVTALAWKNDDLRNGVLAMADRGEINAVELDLKDESGVVGYDSRVPLARRIGAVQQSYVLADALRTLHKRGLWVIGRIVCFRDPILASAAWKAGRRSEVVQTPEGGPYAGYGGFTNFANPVVRAYNIDIAKEAAAAADRRHPLRLRPPPGRPDLDHGLPGAQDHPRDLDRRLHRPDPERAPALEDLPGRLALRRLGARPARGGPGRAAHRAHRGLRGPAGLPVALGPRRVRRRRPQPRAPTRSSTARWRRSRRR